MAFDAAIRACRAVRRALQPEKTRTAQQRAPARPGTTGRGNAWKAQSWPAGVESIQAAVWVLFFSPTFTHLFCSQMRPAVGTAHGVSASSGWLVGGDLSGRDAGHV